MVPDRSGLTTRFSVVPPSRDNPGVRQGQQETDDSGREQPRHKEVATRASYQKDTLREVVLPTTSATYASTMRPKMEETWSYGEGGPSQLAGGGSAAPAGMWRHHGVINQTQGPPWPGQSEVPALCRALQDFNPKGMELEDWKYCLGFVKADILTVIRRVDEHWIEAKLGDKVGILPLQFVEPNSSAAKLLDRKSRKGSDSAELPYRIWSAGVVSGDEAGPAANPPQPPPPPSQSSYNRTGHLFGTLQAPAPKTLNVNGKVKQPSISHALYQSVSRRQGAGPRNPAGYQGDVAVSHHQGATQAGVVQPPKGPAQHVKQRRSDTSHGRHLAQGEKNMNSETPPTITMALVSPQVVGSSSAAEVKNTASSSSSSSSSSSTQQLSISVCAVLYSYKPRRPEELELRKGEMVGVYGRFNEAWLRGLTSARVMETKAVLVPAAAATASYNTTGKRPAAPKNPAVVLAMDRVPADRTGYAVGLGQPSVLNGVQAQQHAMPPNAAGRLSGVSQGWDTVRRVFNSHTVPQRKKHSGFLSAAPGRPPAQGWMSDATPPSAADILKDRDFAVFYHDPAFKQDRQLPNGPHSILVRPNSQKNNTEKPTKSVRFLTEEDSPPIRPRTASWSSGTPLASTGQTLRGPPPLEVWAPSLTLGRDGPGIILKDGKVPVLRKGLESSQISDLNAQKQAAPQPMQHRVVTTYLAQEDAELSLLQGERVLVHRPRPDGRLLVTQESSGHTGLFNSSILQTLERLG
ncbi:hypothetical protein CRUP_033066 [Coryphaenoides rupestris]|nr:hypothetical protein CRUP_033066 [Coryphaenoides rupestris]